MKLVWARSCDGSKHASSIRSTPVAVETGRGCLPWWRSRGEEQACGRAARVSLIGPARSSLGTLSGMGSTNELNVSWDSLEEWCQCADALLGDIQLAAYLSLRNMEVSCVISSCMLTT